MNRPFEQQNMKFQKETNTPNMLKQIYD